MASRREQAPRQAGGAVKRILTASHDIAGVKLTAEKDIVDKISAARARLTHVDPRPSSAAALSAAAFAAATALLMAGVVVVGPGVQIADRAPIVAP